MISRRRYSAFAIFATSSSWRARFASSINSSIRLRRSVTAGSLVGVSAMNVSSTLMRPGAERAVNDCRSNSHSSGVAFSRSIATYSRENNPSPTSALYAHALTTRKAPGTTAGSKSTPARLG